MVNNEDKTTTEMLKTLKAKSDALDQKNKNKFGKLQGSSERRSD